jgi:hypothetical protein
VAAVTFAEHPVAKSGGYQEQESLLESKPIEKKSYRTEILSKRKPIGRQARNIKELIYECLRASVQES